VSTIQSGHYLTRYKRGRAVRPDAYGGYLQSVSFSTSPFGLDFESYGLFAGYDTQKWSIEGYAGSTTLDMQYSSLSSNNIGVTAAFRPTDSFEAFCRFDQSGF
jgi:hypothetical protein